MNTEAEQVAENTAKITPGALLKERREQLGLTQEQIAHRLRLRVTIIKNIEADNFDFDHVNTFTRGYLRSYAKAVGLSEGVVLKALEDCSLIKPEEQIMQSFSKKTNREKHDSRIMIITWAILAIIVGISVLWWWQNQQQDTLMPNMSGEAQQVSAQAAFQPDENNVAGADDGFTTISELSADENNAAQSGETTAESTTTEVEQAITPAGQTTADEPAADAPASAIPQADSNVTQPAAANLLTMTFSGDCWIQVKDSTGKILVTGVKKTGESVNVTGQRPLKVILGAPEAVSMTFASEPVDLSGYNSGKVARFTLP